MVATTLRKWFGVRRNSYSADDQIREIDGKFLGRLYVINISPTTGFGCHYSANSRGEFVFHLHKFYFKWNLRKQPINMTWDANHDAPQYGFALTDGPDLMVYWGQHAATPKRSAHTRLSLWPLPFTWRRYQDFTYTAKGLWVDTTKEPLKPELARVWETPFTYTTKHGEVQESTAIMTLHKRTLRRVWLRWLPWGEQSVNNVRLCYAQEIGHDRSGWKGGVLGGSVDLLKDETPPMALERIIVEQRYG